MKVVLDTNVLISGTFWTGDSFEVLRKIDLKEVMLVLSKELIDEYEEIINSEEIIEKIEDKNLVISEIIKKIIENAIIVSPRTKFNIVKEDPDDNKVLECASEGKVNFIITQDNHLLRLREFQGIKILKPEEFLNLLK